jgi:2-beta-glucuronyltransferase
LRRVLLVSGHHPRSRRRAGFHWLADAYRRLGWHVTFVTVGFSRLSYLRRDHRLADGLDRMAGRPIELEPNFVAYAWYTPYHPLHRLPSIARAVLEPLFRGYGRLPMPGLEPLVTAADLLIFESTSGLMLVDRFRAWNPRARLVYRVSDDLRLLRAHRVVLEAEAEALPRFDLVSVPSAFILERFGDRPNVRLQLHGLDTGVFDRTTDDPYDPSLEARAVFVGNAYLDTEFLSIAAPDHPGWQFHVIGELGRMPDLPNVVVHGELPFAETVPYLQHADVGLSTLRYRPGAESFTDSLKVIQYTYCRLPIVAPDFMRSARANVVTYRPGDRDSIRTALAAARALDRSTIDRSSIRSWDDLARELAGPLGAEPPA